MQGKIFYMCQITPFSRSFEILDHPIYRDLMLYVVSVFSMFLTKMSKFYECNPVFFTIFTRQGNDISFFCKFNIVIGAKNIFSKHIKGR